MKSQKNKYAKEIDELLEDMRLEHEREEAESARKIQEYMDLPNESNLGFELPKSKELPF